MNSRVGIMSALKKERKIPHKLYKLRMYDSAFNVLIVRHLLDDDTKFKEYFRMSPRLFSRILNEITDDVEGSATTWVKKPISAHEKLCITLRYLATGETFRSLAFQFRAHHTTIGRIVSKRLAAIINHFLNAAMPTPTSQLHRRNIEVFLNRWNFPNCFWFYWQLLDITSSLRLMLVHMAERAMQVQHQY